MGMGHVSPRSFPRDCPGSHVPRRERGETGEDGAQSLTVRRASTGAAGERLAAHWLAEQGLEIVAHNIEIEEGEVDLLAVDGARRVAIEVRTITGAGDPIDAVSEAKRRRVRRLGVMLGASRVDYVGIGLHSWGFEVHWVPG